MTIDELQALVGRCHDQHFGKTELRERLRDLSNEVAELTHHRDAKNLVEEAGDAGWSLLQLCNELGLDSRRIAWRRVVDMNDRALRGVVIGLGGRAEG